MSSDNAAKLSKDIDKGIDDAAEQARGGVSSAAALARDTAARAGDAASQIYDKTQRQVRDLVEDLPGNAGEAIAAGQRAYDRGNDVVGRRVTKHPLEALLLAGAIGYLVGWATNRS